LPRRLERKQAFFLKQEKISTADNQPNPTIKC